jgi:putative PIN family toxin of toxin-antitoxin system
LKVLIDANVLISYMLDPESESPPSRLVRAGLAGRIQVLLSEMTIAESTRTIGTKRYLSERIHEDESARFISNMRRAFRILSQTAVDIGMTSRDRDDNYLLAHAVIERVDVIVSGDKDLLVLDDITPFRILSPSAFILILHDQLSSQ